MLRNLLTPFSYRKFPGRLFILIASFLLALGLGAHQLQAQTDTCAGPSVCEATVKPISLTPASLTTYEVSFITPRDIVPLADSIVMELHEDIRTPRASRISGGTVRIQYEREDDRFGGSAQFVSLANQTDPLQPTTLTISHNFNRSGQQISIPAGARITITLQRSAGLGNPTEGGTYDWKVGLGSEGPLVEAGHPDPAIVAAFTEAGIEGAQTGLLVERQIQLSRETISRGQRLTVIGRGYKNGSTLTVWRDANVNGQRDSGESDLCTTEVRSNDIGYCNFTVTVPPFTGGAGICLVNEAGQEPNCNFINAVDGLSGSSIVTNRNSNLIYEDGQVLELVGQVLADVVQGPGGELQLEVVDFPPGEITRVTIGGVEAEVTGLQVEASGALHFSVPVPNSVRLGRQTLQVDLKRNDNQQIYSDDIIINISQPATLLRVTPEQAVPNQRVSLYGSGFSESSDVVIDTVRFGGSILDPSRINSGVGYIETNGSGQWSGQVSLPILQGTAVQGTHLLEVSDSRGRTGSVEVTVPPRELEVTPPWSGPGSAITVSGRGYPSLNFQGSGVTLRVIYQYAGEYTVTTVEPDVNGEFSLEIRIPRRVPAPSSNLIRVEMEDDEGFTIIDTADHLVPGAFLQLTPESGPPGSLVTVRGSGFRQHFPLSSMLFGDIDVSPSLSVYTDASGDFSATFLAPGLDTGRHTVKAEVAGATASGVFILTPDSVSRETPAPIADALEGLDDLLKAVFHFDGNSKNWTFYFPELADKSTLEHMIPGETYFIRVSRTTEHILNGELRNLTCYEDNCWNHIVW